jgi:hypothetical protein
MSTTWRLYTQEIGLLIGSQLLLILIGIVAGLAVAGFAVLPVIAAVSAFGDNGALIAIPVGLVAVPLLFLLSGALLVGQTRLYLNVARGQGAALGDILFGFREGRGFVLSVLLIKLAAAALGLVGTLLCCAPGVIVGLCVWPALPLLLTQNCSGSDAIGRTYELAKAQFGPVLGVGAVAAGVSTVAGMVPYLNTILWLFAVPFALLFSTVGFLRLTEQTSAFD